MEYCIFCENILSKCKSNEHIIPVWLLKSLNIEKEIISPTHYSLTAQKAVSIRKHDINNLVSGGICASCNNGWMSDLEHKVQVNLLKLIECQSVVVDLDRNERFDLARWAFKTALVLNLGSNYHKNIPISHYKFLYENQSELPKNTIILAQQHHYTRPFYWLQQPGWTFNQKGTPKDEKELSEIAENSYKISLQFKHLLLIVAFNSTTDLLFTIWRGIHVPLYPLKGKMDWYEKDGFSWEDSEKALFDFHKGLQLSFN